MPRAVAYIVRGRPRRRAARMQSVIIHEAEVTRALEGLLVGSSPNNHVVLGLRWHVAELLRALRILHVD